MCTISSMDFATWTHRVQSISLHLKISLNPNEIPPYLSEIPSYSSDAASRYKTNRWSDENSRRKLQNVTTRLTSSGNCATSLTCCMGDTRQCGERSSAPGSEAAFSKRARIATWCPSKLDSICRTGNWELPGMAQEVHALPLHKDVKQNHAQLLRSSNSPQPSWLTSKMQNCKKIASIVLENGLWILPVTWAVNQTGMASDGWQRP